MSEPTERIDILDDPLFGRRIMVVTTVVTGVITSLAAAWNLSICVVVRSVDMAFLGAGLLLLVSGIVWFMLPTRAPRLIFRADPNGMAVLRNPSSTKSEDFDTIPWSRVRGVQVAVLGDAYVMEVEASLPEQDLKELRDGYGENYVGSIHTVKYHVPVPGIRKRHLEMTVQRVRDFKQKHQSKNRDMSNMAMQGTVTSGAPLARSRP